MKKLPALLIAITLVAAFAVTAHTQSMETEVIGSAGATTAAAAGTLQWTVGEPMIRTVANAAVLSEGFHQTVLWEIVPVYETPAIQVAVWPNPSSEFIEISTDRPVSIALYDVLGNKAMADMSFDQHAMLETAQLPAGTYFLDISDSHRKRLGVYKVLHFKE